MKKTLRSPLTILTLSLVAACSDDDDDGGPVGDGESTGVTATATGATTITTTEATTTVSTTAAETTAGETGTTTAGADTASIRVVHAAPGAPSVDVYVAGDTQPVITDLAYGEASDYLQVPAGSYAFEVRAAGSPADDPAAYTTGELELVADARITAVAAGVLGSTDEADTFRVLPLVEGFADPGAGNALVRVVHAGADAPTVDIDVGNDGTAELTGVDRFADSGPEGVPLPAGSALQVGIVAGGETVTAFTTPALPEGAELFVIATGLLADLPREETGFGLLAVGPTGAIGIVQQNPFVYALHASPDAGAVDICLGDTALVSGADYNDMARLQVPPGSYDLDFRAAPSGCSGEPLSTQSTGELAAGQQYLAIATGEVMPEAGDDTQTFRLVGLQERFDLTADPNAAVRVVHAAIAPPVDVGTVDEMGMITDATVLFPNLAWPNESLELAVPAGEYEIGVVAADAMLPQPPLASFLVPLAEGTRAWAVAVGDLTPDGGEPGFAVWAILTNTSPWTLVELSPI